MKKILSLLSVVIIALCTFTSCDEDLMISTSLKGTWEGYMDTYYDISGRKQKATYTEIQFFKDAGDTHGEGYWIDHFSNRPGDYYYSRIRWKVIDRDITIDFKDSHTTINIHNYDIVTRNNRKYFTGWFQDDYHTLQNSTSRKLQMNTIMTATMAMVMATTTTGAIQRLHVVLTTQKM